VPDSTVTSGISPDSLVLEGCQFIDTTITFVYPRDTLVNFQGIPLTVPFIDFVIDGVDGLPPGLNWTCNLSPNCRYVVHPDSAQVDTVGCLRVFGMVSVPGPYNVQVNFTAQVDAIGNILTQPSSLPFPVIVQPCAFQGDCYTLDFSSNCEPSELTITNHLPSQGRAGVSYQWDISGPNGFAYQSTDETPAPQLLSAAGEYVVDFEANYDTVGYRLNGLSIEAVNCSDLFDAGDLYWILIDPAGNEVVNTSSNPINNGGNNLPISTGIGGFLLDTGRYEFQVWDQDGIFAGGDDGCATGANNGGASVFFSVPTSQSGRFQVTQDGLRIGLDVNNPIQTAACRDTFGIDSLPPVPSLLWDSTRVGGDSLLRCVGDRLTLYTDSRDSVRWLLGDSLLLDPGDSLDAQRAGDYYALAIDRQTLCRVRTASVRVDTFAVPTPVVEGPSTFCVGDTVQLSASSADSLRWFLGDSLLPMQGRTLLVDRAGTYVALAIDRETLCQARAAPRSIDGVAVAAPRIELDSTAEVFFVANPQGSFRYVWSNAAGDSLGAGTGFDPDSNGLYQVVAVDLQRGCRSAPSNVIDFVSDIGAVASLPLRVYPNPTAGDFTLEATLSQPLAVQLRLYDLTGRQLWQVDLGVKAGFFRASLQPPHLPSGLYLLRLQAGDQLGQQRLVVER